MNQLLGAPPSTALVNVLMPIVGIIHKPLLAMEGMLLHCPIPPRFFTFFRGTSANKNSELLKAFSNRKMRVAPPLVFFTLIPGTGHYEMWNAGIRHDDLSLANFRYRVVGEVY